jgi:hypothetical protein
MIRTARTIWVLNLLLWSLLACVLVPALIVSAIPVLLVVRKRSRR